VPHHRTDCGRVRPVVRWEGDHRQDERRREPERADEVRRDLHPDAADVQRRQARRPRYWRYAEGESEGVHRSQPLNQKSEGRKQKSWRSRASAARISAFCLLISDFHMLSDLDALLRARSIDTFLVPMHEVLHPAFRWIIRGAKVTKGYAVKCAGEELLL